MKYPKMPKKCIKYSLILCLICVIIYLLSNNVENYTAAQLKSFKKESKSTPMNDGPANVAYLDRHKVECDGLISQFKLGRSTDGKKYAYKYKCLNKNDKQKLVKDKVKQTSKVTPTEKSMDLVGKALNCYDPNDKDKGLVSFQYRNAGGKAYYDYTCGKIVPKTAEELKKEEEIEAQKKKVLDEIENKINNAKPKTPGCYIYANEGDHDGKCKNLTDGKWKRDTWGELNKGTFFDEKKCKARAKDFKTYCKSNVDWRTHYNKYNGKYTKPYDSGKGNTVYLDGHDVNCGDNKFIKKINLKNLGDKYTYLYQCN